MYAHTVYFREEQKCVSRVQNEIGAMGSSILHSSLLETTRSHVETMLYTIG